MKQRLLALALALLLLLPLACATGQEALVERVIDGDTIVLQGGERVRYIGIDAPEMDQPWGKEAKELNRQLVEGKRVRLERDITDRDRYNRLLRYVYVGEVLAEGELVRQGLARAKAYLPDTRYQKLLEGLEAEARSQGRGLWSAPSGR